jgi:PAS domain S-box-containing protein
MSSVRDPSRAAHVARRAAKPVGPTEPSQEDDTSAGSSSALLAAIESALDDAIVGSNRNGIITSWNRAAERLFGYAPREAIGCSMRMIVPRDRYGEHDDALARALRGEHVSSPETRRLMKSGHALAMSFRMSPVWTADEVAGVVMIAHDISQRQHGEREAFRQGTIAGASTAARDVTDQKRAIEEANEANRQKDEFLAVLSHELRTPLNAIMGWADMLISTRMDEASTVRALASIQRNARVQAQLIEDLLDISRIVAGKLALNREHVDLGVVIGAAIEDLRPEIDAKRIDLRATVGPDANAVIGDAPRLQQVVSNLLSNAVKFTPPGGRIDVSLERLGDDRAQITVRDSGQGIAPEFLAHVFDRFRQGDSSATRRHGGLGLGLGIVKHLVEAHGGTVSASSEGLGKGSVFTASLPLRPSTSPTVYRSADGEVLPTHTLAHVRALVVDDDHDAAELLLFALERVGAHVTAATSAIEAMDALARDSFDVILADIGMPDVDGHDLIRAVRAEEHRSGREPIAAVAITAHAGPGDRDRALLAGFDWHLTKPVEPREVIAVVARMTR